MREFPVDSDRDLVSVDRYGTVIRTRVPPSRSSILRSPPPRVTSQRTNHNPSPLPCRSAVSLGCSRTAASSGRIPGPSSITSMSIAFILESAVRTETRTVGSELSLCSVAFSRSVDNTPDNRVLQRILRSSTDTDRRRNRRFPGHFPTVLFEAATGGPAQTVHLDISGRMRRRMTSVASTVNFQVYPPAIKLPNPTHFSEAVQETGRECSKSRNLKPAPISDGLGLVETRQNGLLPLLTDTTRPDRVTKPQAMKREATKLINQS